MKVATASENPDQTAPLGTATVFQYLFYDDHSCTYLHNFLNFFIISGMSTGFPEVTNNSTKLDICWHIVSSRLSPDVGFGNLFDDDIMVPFSQANGVGIIPSAQQKRRE